MARVADVKLTWRRSPSLDISRVEVRVNNNGQETTAQVGPEVESYVVEVRARSAVSFTVTVYDAEGGQATSATYSFLLHDLEAPLPATDLSHEVLGVRDVPDDDGGGTAPVSAPPRRHPTA